MKFLDNMKISSKILMVIALMSTVTLFLVGLGAVELHGIDKTYSVIANNQLPARLETTRMTRSVINMAYAAYRTIAHDGASAEAKAAEQSAMDNYAGALRYLASAEGLEPEHKQIFDGYKTRIDAIQAIVKRAVAHGMKNENDEADMEMIKGDELIAALTADVQKFNEAELDKAKAATAAASDNAASTIVMSIAIGIVGLAISVGFGLWLSIGKISRPLTRLGERMSTLAQGKLDIEVEGTDRKDEVGQMARTVLVFREAGVEKVRLEGAAAEQRKQTEAQRLEADTERRRNADAQAAAAEEQAGAIKALADGLTKMSEGDLTIRLNEGFTEAYRQIKDDFNTTVGRLGETIGAIVGSTREVTNASAEISTSTTDLSQRTEEQAASLEETSASMEEIAVTVKKNAENAQQANESANKARDVADRGGKVVARAVDAMAQIEGSSGKIADIITVIDEIARQTNLLALNAAVEAARAGDAGRGFAVVASEVRTLAQRSSQAAKDIKDLITNSNGQVKEGVALVNQAGSALAEILESIKEVAGVVSGIATASAEQAVGIEQVNKALAQMDEVTQQNSALVEENAATAKTLEQQSSSMEQRIAFFHLDNAAVADASGSARAPLIRPAALKRPMATRQPATGVKAAPSPRRTVAAANGGPVGRMQTKLATALKSDPDWKEF
jgi:methyl-accepting chemotaxis protein